MATMTAFAAWSAAIGTAVSVYSTVEAGNERSKNLQIQARAEESNAKTQEIQRKKNLINALAMGNVEMGASGVAGASKRALQLADINAAELDMLTDKANTTARTLTLMSNAKTARNMSLISAAGQSATAMGKYKKRGELPKTGYNSSSVTQKESIFNK